MLQSFVGTFDAVGLRTLQTEGDSIVPGQLIPCSAGSVPFWAILDTAVLPPIQHALSLGYRSTAWEILAQQATCLGRLCE